MYENKCLECIAICGISNLMKLGIWVGLLLFLPAIMGCGSDKKVTVGEPGEDGTYKRSVDAANNVSNEENKRLSEGEKTAYGEN